MGLGKLEDPQLSGISPSPLFKSLECLVWSDLASVECLLLE